MQQSGVYEIDFFGDMMLGSIACGINNYYYENLHPIDDQDRQETIRLVKIYIESRYQQEYGFKENLICL